MAVKLISGAGSYSGSTALAGSQATSSDTELSSALQVLGRLKHPNLTCVLGACSWDLGQWLVLEERCACSLAQVLYGRGGQCDGSAAVPQRLPLNSVLKVRGSNQDKDWSGVGRKCSSSLWWRSDLWSVRSLLYLTSA